MDTFDKNKKLLATILNKVFCMYNQKKYRSILSNPTSTSKM